MPPAKAPDAAILTLAARDFALLAMTARAEAAEARIAELHSRLQQAQAALAILTALPTAEPQADSAALARQFDTLLNIHQQAAGHDRRLRRAALLLRDQIARTAIAARTGSGGAR